MSRYVSDQTDGSEATLPMAHSAAFPAGIGHGVAAGDRAESSGSSMSQSVSTRQGSRPARPEPRGAAPLLFGAARPGFVGDASDAAVLERCPPPLVRRPRRRRERIGGRLAGSGIVHLLALVLLSISFSHPPGGQPQESQPVEMLYQKPGSSSMTGEPNPAPSPPAASRPVPDEQPPTPMPPVAAPPPLPLPELPSPEALPKPLAKASPTQTHQSAPNSAFSHPMDLSFAQAPHASHRPGRRAGFGGAVDLSLGPLVHNGQILTPYASTTSVRGVSSDYAEEISDWIRRHMYYPEDAAHRGEDGPSSVHVVLDRQGQVKSIRLVSSSGSYSLDDATQGMFRNARLPPVPPDMSGAKFDVDLTIDYILIRR